MRPHAGRRAVAVSGAALVVLAALPALAAARPAADPTALASVIPSWARGVHPAAAEPATATVHFALALRGRDEAALTHLVSAVSTPGSSSYRHFLTTAQYNARFAPTAVSATLVRTWLTAQGLTVDGTTPGRGLVYAHGSADAVGTAFHTSFGLFQVAGALRRAPLTQPQLPATLRGVVSGIDGLAQTEMQSTASPGPAFVNARPCSKYYGQKVATTQPKYDGKRQPDAICGYTPAQVRSAYGLGATSLKVGKKALTGKGVTVAIVDAYASPTIAADAATFSRKHGLPQFAKGQFSQTLFPGATSVPEVNQEGLALVDPQGWAGEETLDVEAVHMIAPKANIAYYAAAFPEDVTLFTALAQVIGDGKAQVISNSYGSVDDSPDPADMAVFDDLMNQAAVKGITVDFSSGDDGDEVANLGERSADFPATSTGVTAVGGTTLEVNKAGKRVAETYWGTEKAPLTNGKWDFSQAVLSGAGGGGVSTSYAEPAWQKGIVPTSEATFGGVPAGRVVPDVSMVADSTTGILIGQTEAFAGGKTKYGEYRIGGTSVSCPLFSGVIALTDQLAHKGVGLITPTIYADAKAKAGRVRLFNDPTNVATSKGQALLANVRPDFTDTTDPHSTVTYSLRTLGNLGTLHWRRGYDDSTGLGSPKVAALVAALG